jgi:hypothetical protein
MTGLRGVRKDTVAVFLLTILLTAGLAFTAGMGRAEAPKIVVPADTYHGIVVTNKGRVMKIGKTQYLVSPQVIVTDRQSKRREAGHVLPGDSIAFHMTKGVIDRIDCHCPPILPGPRSR